MPLAILYPTDVHHPGPVRKIGTFRSSGTRTLNAWSGSDRVSR